MSDKQNKKDQLFAEKMSPQDFVFDDKVAAVFDDMVNRSIPGYSTILSMIGVLAERYYQEGSQIYDLGCSLGGASYAIAQQLSNKDCSILAVDNSSAMIERLQHRLSQEPALPIHCRREDILDSEISNASMVVLNFTLQFVDPQRRQELMDKIYEGLKPGGMVLISEKIIAPDPQLNNLLIELYHDFKENMGYSKLEISQKRDALENVLVPETLGEHRDRLTNSGFRAFDVWFQCFNFASMIAFK